MEGTYQCGQCAHPIKNFAHWPFGHSLLIVGRPCARLRGPINIRLKYHVGRGFYIPNMPELADLRCTPLCARVHNYTAFVLKSLILLCIAPRNCKWKYTIFLLLLRNTKLLTMTSIKLSDEDNNFEALIYASRD